MLFNKPKRRKVKINPNPATKTTYVGQKGMGKARD